MELTIDQALQQGIAAHKEGKLQDAERLYRAILQSQPSHPDANHNLGVLAVSINKADSALPLFKTAIEANPNQEQFWLSYVDALIKEQQFDGANQALEQAKKQGIDEEILNALEKQLKLTLQVGESQSISKSKVSEFSQKNKNQAEVEKDKKKKEYVKDPSPTQQQVSSLVGHYQNRRFSDVEKLAVSITKEYPKYPFAYKVLGAVLKETGRITESLTSTQRSIQLEPEDAGAYSNLGNTLQELGRLEEAKASCRQAIALKPDLAEAHYNLGITLNELGRLAEAETSYRQAVMLNPNLAEGHGNLGVILKELGRLEEAEVSYRQAIALRTNYAEAHYNLGVTLNELGRLDEAEASYTQAIELKLDDPIAHYNLGVILNELGRFDEAEASYKQAIALSPDYAEAHSNVGDTLQKLGRLEEAEVSYRQAIALKADYVEAHNNLGIMLNELGRYEEAQTSYKQAISLNPYFSEAHSNLGKVFYIEGHKDLALKSIARANYIDPVEKEFRLLLRVMKSRKSCAGREASLRSAPSSSTLTRLTPNPLILNRSVEPELIPGIYEMSFMEIDKIKTHGLLPSGRNDARYGNGICSPDFNLFKDSRSIIQNVSEDLTRIMMNAVKSDIFIFDSFYNILRAGGGLAPHVHLSKLDKDINLKLGGKKYSLVYYLDVGDQNCSEPGILKLYDPVENILPRNGMITIINSNRRHSVVYNGKTDRVMIGVNFYSV